MKREDRGNVYIEYFVIALVVWVVTAAFYTTHLQDPGSVIRAELTSVFMDACKKVAGTNNCG